MDSTFLRRSTDADLMPLDPGSSAARAVLH
jgi:hypothetical protein